MDRSFETGFHLDMSHDTTVREDDDDPFDLKSLIHSTSKAVIIEDPKIDTLVQIEEDPWSAMDWDRLHSEASALAALAQEENTDWDAIEVEASAVAGSIKFSNNLFSSSSPMSPLSLESPLSTICSADMSPDLLNSPPSSGGLLKLSLNSNKKSTSQNQRSPLMPANHILNEKVSMSEFKKKNNYLPKKPSTLTFPPKKLEDAKSTANKKEKPSRLPSISKRHAVVSTNSESSASFKAQSRSISVPKKCAKSSSPSREQPELRRSISNMSQSQLQSFKSKEITAPSLPYMKKSLTLPRKRPTSKQGSNILPKTNTTPSVHRSSGQPFGNSVVSSTPAQKATGAARSVKFAQPGLPSPIIKYSRFKK